MKIFISTTLYLVFLITLGYKFPSIPQIGNFLSPFRGFTQNALMLKEETKSLEIKALPVSQEVSVIYDSAFVPHIYAQNQEDLYAAQGYLLAKDRLWQMDIQSRSGFGELSEVIGDKTIEMDRLMRRLDMRGACDSLIAQMKSDQIYFTLEQYTKGVNAYIENLEEKNYPIEFKLIGYEPRSFKEENIALLMKIMSMRLTAMEADIENSNFVEIFGMQAFDTLFPNFYDFQSPIIPITQSFSYMAQVNEDQIIPIGKSVAAKKPALANMDRNLGSNNWAVAPKKSSSGFAMLCNDPHLKIHLPAIWYEVHLSCPDLNVQGVTMPGAPGVVIGFNDSISWGVTNAGRDVRNWYSIVLNNQNQMLLDSQWISMPYRIDTILVNNGATVYDTTYMTPFGPLVYDASFNPIESKTPLALGWTHFLKSDELLTFYKLNKANNHDDYLDALASFYCPGQNFVYADTRGNIAIKQQGLFPNTPKNFDKFILSGTISAHKMTRFINQAHNPYSLNPEQGFIFSANQHPTSSAYPYYYSSGDFEAYRNRRLYDLLSSKSKLSIADMKAFQSDNFSLMAKEFLTLMSKYLSEKQQIDAQPLLSALSKWDFQYHTHDTLATFSDIWIKKFETMVWDEIDARKEALDYPKQIVLYQMCLKDTNFSFFDRLETKHKVENLRDMVQISFDEAKKSYDTCKNKSWYMFKDTEIPHLAFIPAFGTYHVKTGGNKHILNATWKDWAPSWRMIVEMNPERISAYVMYPGGQSGLIGSKFYDDNIKHWENYQYRKIILYRKDEAKQIPSLKTIRFTPA
ncbi:MAG: penicillin acylase family protein [Chitinophagales bacterium]|nr:penicillin acylase family protein [Chitinophagales bacterium]